MEIVKVLAIDPSLRNSGIAVLKYNTEISPTDPKAFEVMHCQVLVNPKVYTGTNAIMNMLKMMHVESSKLIYQDIDVVLVESPAAIFNKAWAAGAIASISHISGGAAMAFGIDKANLFRPTEWNRSRKKDVTHNNTVAFLGNPDNWQYETRVKSEKFMEHILDAASMALWWVKDNFVEEENA